MPKTAKKKKKTKKKKARKGPRGGTPRTDASGERHQLNIYMHERLIALMDDDRAHVSRRAWLETVLCKRFKISTKEIA